jgi:coproporphyrinogen III oxidase
MRKPWFVGIVVAFQWNVEPMRGGYPRVVQHAPPVLLRATLPRATAGWEAPGGPARHAKESPRGTAAALAVAVALAIVWRPKRAAAAYYAQQPLPFVKRGVDRAAGLKMTATTEGADVAVRSRAEPTVEAEITKASVASGADASAVYGLIKEMQSFFVQELENITLESDASQQGAFEAIEWLRDGGKHGGGTRYSVEDTPVFNRASVNVSQVHYEDVPTSAVTSATALSVILHPKNPHAPSMHFHMSYTEPRNSGGEDDRKPSWRMIADLNPAIEDKDDTAAFDFYLRKVVPNEFFNDAQYFGDKYFYIPDLGRTRGACHVFIPKLDLNDMALANSMSVARSLAKSTIQVYADLVSGALERWPERLVTEEARKAQLAYHTLYFYQVLLLDRGTTAGLLVHDDNDVGTLGSLPSQVDASLLAEWQDRTNAPNGELLRRLRALLPPSGTADMSDQLRADLAKTVRDFYSEDRSRMEGQAWMDLEWWATGRKLKGQRVSA